MIRFPSFALAAIVAAVSFTVAFAMGLASHDEGPRAAAGQALVGGPSSPVAADPARLRSVAALPALHVPRPARTPAAPTFAVAPESPPVAPSDDEPAPLPAAPTPVAPAPSAPAPVAPPPAPPAPEQGPVFDSSG